MGTPTKPSIEPENGPLKKEHPYLDGSFNQVENYKSNWIISPGKGEHNKIFETTKELGKHHFQIFQVPAVRVLGCKQL